MASYVIRSLTPFFSSLMTVLKPHPSLLPFAAFSEPLRKLMCAKGKIETMQNPPLAQEPSGRPTPNYSTNSEPAFFPCIPSHFGPSWELSTALPRDLNYAGNKPNP